MFSQNVFSLNYFHKFLLCESLRNSLSTGRNADTDKVAYSWISLDPAKAGPTLGSGVVVVTRLCRDLRCLVTSYDDTYVLQDHTSRILISAGEQLGGSISASKGHWRRIKQTPPTKATCGPNVWDIHQVKCYLFLLSSLGVNFSRSDEV